MSVVFKCDRCGEIFNRKVPDINDCYGTANSILFLDCTVERNRFGLGEEPIQLCPSCMKQLNDWLTPDEQKPDTGNKNEWNSMRERKVRMVATVGQLLFHLADCIEAGLHRNEDEEVRT